MCRPPARAPPRARVLRSAPPHRAASTVLSTGASFNNYRALNIINGNVVAVSAPNVGNTTSSPTSTAINPKWIYLFSNTPGQTGLSPIQVPTSLVNSTNMAAGVGTYFAGGSGQPVRALSLAVARALRRPAHSECVARRVHTAPRTPVAHTPLPPLPASPAPQWNGNTSPYDFEYQVLADGSKVIWICDDSTGSSAQWSGLWKMKFNTATNVWDSVQREWRPRAGDGAGARMFPRCAPS